MTRDDLIGALAETRFRRGSDDWKRAVSELDDRDVNVVVAFVGNWIEDCRADAFTNEELADVWREEMSA